MFSRFGNALARRPVGRKAPLAIPAYFTMVHVASLKAMLDLMRGVRIDRWEPRRSVEARPMPVDVPAPSAQPTDEHDRPTGIAV